MSCLRVSIFKRRISLVGESEVDTKSKGKTKGGSPSFLELKRRGRGRREEVTSPPDTDRERPSALTTMTVKAWDECVSTGRARNH